MTLKAWFPLDFPTFYFNEEQEVTPTPEIEGIQVTHVPGVKFKLLKVVDKKLYIVK